MFEYLSPLQQTDYSKLGKFFFRGQHAGFIRHDYAAMVLEEMPDDFIQKSNGLHLADDKAADGAMLGQTLDNAYHAVRARGGSFIGSPDEYMAIALDLDPSKPIAKRLRNNNLFGLPFYGVHVNLFSRAGNDVKIWLARRSKKVFTYPDCWDLAVGGGLTYGYTPRQAAHKEAHEEAGLTDDYLKGLNLARIVDQTFDNLYMHGYHIDHQFYFDLEVPQDFVPTPIDQEAEAFISVSAEEAWVILQDGANWKHNAAVTILDFGLRHGLYNPPKDVRDHILACLHQRPPLDGLPAEWPPTSLLDESAA